MTDQPNPISPLARRLQQLVDASGAAQRAIAQRAGIPESTLRNILNGTSTSPRSDTLGKLAQALDVTEQYLLTGSDAAAPQATPVLPNARPAPGLVLPANFNLPRDLPALGTAAGSELGRGAFQLSTDVVDYLRRPPALLGVRDAYALYVEGESMSPRFEPGDPIFVHPHRKAQPGDYIVIQEPDGSDEERRAFIKRLVKVTGTTLRVQQFNPAGTIDFVIRPGLIWHKVLTDADLWSF